MPETPFHQIQLRPLRSDSVEGITTSSRNYAFASVIVFDCYFKPFSSKEEFKDLFQTSGNYQQDTNYHLHISSTEVYLFFLPPGTAYIISPVVTMECTSSKMRITLATCRDIH